MPDLGLLAPPPSPDMGLLSPPPVTSQLGLLTSTPQAADPLDFSAKFNTPLAPTSEAAFQAWLAAHGKTGDLYDYDMRGWWDANGRPQATDAAHEGHFTDQFKKPNHPTFSDESVYHGTGGYEGGSWGDGTFRPGSANLSLHGPAALRAYFQRVEPDYRLILPGGSQQ